LSFDKSDDDNERDHVHLPLRPAPTFWRRSTAGAIAISGTRFNGWLIAHIGGGIFLNNRLSIYSAQPTSASCGPSPLSPFAPPRDSGPHRGRTVTARMATVLQRNTLRRTTATSRGTWG